MGVADRVELSIVIPTFNRAERLRACLDALNRQTASMESVEVVVVVDGSTDATTSMLETYRSRFLLRPVWQSNAGQPVALNRGIAEARGRFCLFIDDDILAGPELVAQHLQAQRSRDDLLAVGRLTLELPPDADWYARAFAMGWERHYCRLAAHPHSMTWEDCYSGNLSVSRGRLLDCGGFATDLARGFDVELGYRLIKAGCLPVYLPAAAGAQDERKRFAQLSGDAGNAGASDLALYLRDPAMLTETLGSFAAGGPWRTALRRSLLAADIQPAALARLGPLLPGARLRYALHKLIQSLAYWRGVRRAPGSSAIWNRLLSSRPW